ncbi:hypothetical protein [Pseudoalteromonas denitrificans]|jgi:hypothetical protein|uniref:Uncharacterized protein n=1 Tax=Pseudoalteromonas denitrificans DSM 6059 TaxID=1123010 RepID=A0A1I1JJY3_9GAMM|nr:hypothetical protein [Pseudoalteromonas denitrificans]SFC48796.1 hypothetical protein SAMN02745724_01783 [Pseudoalteromonas denitrificans DSM 6059]
MLDKKNEDLDDQIELIDLEDDILLETGGGNNPNIGCEIQSSNNANIGCSIEIS